jgi:hypothetical protein
VNEIRVRKREDAIADFTGINPPKAVMPFIAFAHMGKGIGYAFPDAVAKDRELPEADINAQRDRHPHLPETRLSGNRQPAP